MANTIQSKKRARQNEKRYAVNKARRSRIRTYLRKVEEAIASGDKEAAAAASFTRTPPRGKCRGSRRG
jgi:small subunit ribosomal protein S20